MALGAQEESAYEYHVASQLSRFAEARKRKAHAAAVKAGVMFDHLKDPMEPGTAQVVYAGAVIEISVAVGQPVAGIDHDGFVEGLLLAGVKLSLIKRLSARHATDTRPAHTFTSSLVTGG
jgi:hypothetical protein